jgi:hypothetical protein
LVSFMLEWVICSKNEVTLVLRKQSGGHAVDA